MNKDLYLDIPYEKNIQKFPTRISSKIPVQIALHNKNSIGNNDNGHTLRVEKSFDNPSSKPITINSFPGRIHNPYSSSFHSYFDLGQTPSDSSSSSNTTQKTFFNNNNNTEYPFKFDEDTSIKDKKESYTNKEWVNPSEDYTDSVTLAVLNSEEYTKKLIRASRDSFIFDYEKDYRNFESSNKDEKEHNDTTKTSKTKEEKIYKQSVSNEMLFNPNESPIIIPDKPSNNKIDMSKSVLFKNSYSSIESISSSSSINHPIKKRSSIKNARNSINLTKKRSSSMSSHNRKGSNSNGTSNDYEDYILLNMEKQSKVRSYSLPRQSVELRRLDTRARSNTLPRSMIISPAKDEKFFICASPKKESYSIHDIKTANSIEFDKRNNYSLYDDDKGSFIYNQSEIISPSVCDYSEYRNLLKSKNFEIPDAIEERKHRSLSRKHESRYRSLSRTSDSESHRRSRSKNKNDRKTSPTRYNENGNESRYRSLSRTRRESRERERRESRERDRKESSRERRRDSKERRRSSSRHKKSGHRKHKSSSNNDSPLSIPNTLTRNNSPGSNMGSPLARKSSYSSPLATNSIINKFSTSYIQHDSNKSPYDTRNINNNKLSLPYNKNEYPVILNNDEEEEEFKLIKNSGEQHASRNLSETQNADIINEICDLKKFSQEFSGLNILESILNKPIEDDFEFLNYKRISDVQKLENKKYSTLSRIPSQNKHRNKSRELRRRNSDMDFRKTHKRVNSDQTRMSRNDEGSNKGSKRNIFNFFSNHKKSRSYSSISSDRSSNSDRNKLSDFDKMIKSNETIKIKLQPANRVSTSSYYSKSDYSSDSEDSDINNERYSSSYKTFIKEKMMNQKQTYHQPINNIKDYTPLFRVNMMHNNALPKYNDLDLYGTKKEFKNPYDQFNNFNNEELDKKEKQSIKINTRKSSLNNIPYMKNHNYGNKRNNY